MIAIIRFDLNRGVISKDYLHDLAKSIYQHALEPGQLARAQAIQEYIANMYDDSVYTCAPRPGSQASFLWLTDRQFEVVIQTSYQGHLLRTSESVVRELHRRLGQLDMNAEFSIDLRVIDDAQTYIRGKSNRLLERLWDELKGNLIACFVGVIIIIIAKLWLTDYYEEAIASVVSLVLFSLWEMYTVWNENREQPVDWRIDHG